MKVRSVLLTHTPARCVLLSRTTNILVVRLCFFFFWCVCGVAGAFICCIIDHVRGRLFPPYVDETEFFFGTAVVLCALCLYGVITFGTCALFFYEVLRYIRTRYDMRSQTRFVAAVVFASGAKPERVETSRGKPDTLFQLYIYIYTYPRIYIYMYPTQVLFCEKGAPILVFLSYRIYTDVCVCCLDIFLVSAAKVFPKDRGGGTFVVMISVMMLFPW